ncbi:hypothetical protein A2389_01765 [Candidatus Adlerbacteria bacterium RIFOXYB1_FULL_48_10]|nr:MAG: hypothetical protein A2389_01765 [Candidatus Adlerbacteria bacterium RIFOXYB1_FULL_48_10]
MSQLFHFRPGEQGRMNLADGMVGHLHRREQAPNFKDQIQNRFQGEPFPSNHLVNKLTDKYRPL